MVKENIILALIKKKRKYIEFIMINNKNNKIITSISTRDIKKNGSKNNTKSSRILALNILKYIKKIKINKVIIKRNKKKYHGKIKKISEIIKKK